MRELDGSLQCDLVSPSDVGKIDSHCWAALSADGAVSSSPFLSRTFAVAAAQSSRHVAVAIARKRGEAVAFFPFEFGDLAAMALRSGQAVGGSLSDCFGVVAAPGQRLSPELLLRMARLNSLAFDHLPDGQSALGLAGSTIDTGVRMPVRRDPGAYWAAQRAKDKHLLADVRRREKRLISALGPLRFEYQAAHPEAALRDLIEAKRRQYYRTGVNDPLRSPRARTLLSKLLAARDENCTGVLSVLHAGDTWAAAHFGLRSGSLLHYWFPVHNEELAGYGPGHLLLKQLVDRSEELGIDIIDQGAGMQPHKTRYVVEQVQYHRGRWTRGGIFSRLSSAEQGVRWRVDVLGRRLRRLTTKAAAPESPLAVSVSSES